MVLNKKIFSKIKIFFILILILLTAGCCIMESKEEFGGIGVQLTSLSGEIIKTEDDLKIEKVFNGGAAEKAGLIIGDRIIEINGVSVKNKTFSDIYKHYMRGVVGTDIRLTIKRGNSIKKYTLKRGLIELIK